MSKSPFLQLVSDTMYDRRYAKRTIETYLVWIKGYIYFHQKKHLIQMGDIEVEAYLNHLVLRNDVAVSTQSTALNALAFLYRERKLSGQSHQLVSQRSSAELLQLTKTYLLATAFPYLSSVHSALSVVKFFNLLLLTKIYLLATAFRSLSSVYSVPSVVKIFSLLLLTSIYLLATIHWINPTKNAY